LRCPVVSRLFFFFNDPPPTEIYTLSLHDALPICADTTRLPNPCVTPKEPAVSADPTQVLAFETDCHIFDGCGFPSPGLHSFVFEPLWGDGDSNLYFNKVMLLALIGSLVVILFFWAAFRRPRVVPGKLQMVAEAGYDFVRRGVVYETMGKRQGEKYVPFIVALFFFVWMMNL